MLTLNTYHGRPDFTLFRSTMAVFLDNCSFQFWFLYICYNGEREISGKDPSKSEPQNFKHKKKIAKAIEK